MKRFMLIILAVSTVLVSGVSCSKEDPQQKLPEGALPGEFSISATKKVHFSQGNLVATIDASGVPVAWKFATKQHDYLGEGGANGTIGTAAGDIDLFCWSTDATSNNWGIYTMTEITEGVTDGNFNDWGKISAMAMSGVRSQQRNGSIFSAMTEVNTEGQIMIMILVAANTNMASLSAEKNIVWSCFRTIGIQV